LSAILVTTHLQLCLQYHCSPAGALLFDARQLFEQQNARADEALRSIVGQLAEAVTTCVDAAAAELDPVRQAALMKVRAPGLTLAVTTLLLDHHAINIHSNKSRHC